MLCCAPNSSGVLPDERIFCDTWCLCNNANPLSWNVPQVSRAMCQGLTLTASDLCLAAGLASAVHVAFLCFNMLCVRALRLGGKDPVEAARLKQALVLQVRALARPLITIPCGTTARAVSY